MIVASSFALTTPSPVRVRSASTASACSPPSRLLGPRPRKSSSLRLARYHSLPSPLLLLLMQSFNPSFSAFPQGVKMGSAIGLNQQVVCYVKFDFLLLQGNFYSANVFRNQTEFKMDYRNIKSKRDEGSSSPFLPFSDLRQFLHLLSFSPSPLFPIFYPLFFVFVF